MGRIYADKTFMSRSRVYRQISTLSEHGCPKCPTQQISPSATKDRVTYGTIIIHASRPRLPPDS